MTLTAWTIILGLLGLCSVAAMAIFIERLLFLRQAETDSDSLVVNLRTALAKRNFVDATALCQEAGGSVAAILKAGIDKHLLGTKQMEQAFEIAGMIEIARLEQNARILSLIAHIAPLIGLLGTVLGFIQAFGEMRMSGLVDISTTRLGEAMEYALITTAAGLVIAIPSLLAYNYLVSRIERMVLEIQATTAEIFPLLVHDEV